MIVTISPSRGQRELWIRLNSRDALPSVHKTEACPHVPACRVEIVGRGLQKQTHVRCGDWQRLIRGNHERGCSADMGRRHTGSAQRSVLSPGQVERMLTPGAASSTWGPEDDQEADILAESVAATAITESYAAGYSTSLVASLPSPELPAAATRSTPAA